MDWQLLAESLAPEFDLFYWLSVGWRVLHVLAAAALVGGLFFLKQVVSPSVEGAENVEEAVYRGQRATWSRIVMFTTLGLLASGFYNYMTIIGTNENLPGLYHGLFGVKFILAMFVFFIAAATAGKSPVADKVRANLGKWLNLCLVAILAIFLLAAMLRSFEKTPKPADKFAAELLPALETIGNHHG